MNLNEKLDHLSRTLSRHLDNLRTLGGMHSLSARESVKDGVFGFEIDWRGITQKVVSISKPTEQEALEEVAKAMQLILMDEAVGLRAIAERKIKQAVTIDEALLNVTEAIIG